MKRISTAAISLVLTVGITLLVLTGCASTGVQPPPTALEQKIFTVTTNVVTQTNWVNQTNYTQQVITTTNVQNQVVTTTNLIPVLVPTPQIVLQTNYVYDASQSQSMANTLGSLGGPWGTVAGAIVAGVLGIWGGLKNKQANTASAIATSGVQAIEAARKVIAALPNGSALSTAYDNWLKAHQADANVAQEVATLVDDVVNTTQGETASIGAAGQILAAAVQPINPTSPAAPIASAANVANAGKV